MRQSLCLALVILAALFGADRATAQYAVMSPMNANPKLVGLWQRVAPIDDTCQWSKVLRRPDFTFVEQASVKFAPNRPAITYTVRGEWYVKNGNYVEVIRSTTYPGGAPMQAQARIVALSNGPRFLYLLPGGVTITEQRAGPPSDAAFQALRPKRLN